MSVSRALLVFAKAPKPGKVKTRLLDAVSAEQAAALHAACIGDTLRLSRSLRGCDVIWFVAGGRSYFQKSFKAQKKNASVRILSQQGVDLGARLERAFGKTARAGYREVVVIGTDTPWMGVERLRASFAALQRNDAVIGPAEDGGYYLLGMRKFTPEIFRKIPWSTEHVLQSTMKAIEVAKLRVRVLRKDFDLDRPEDLWRAGRMLKRKARRATSLARMIAQICGRTET